MGACQSGGVVVPPRASGGYQGYGRDWMGDPVISAGKFTDLYTIHGKNGAKKKLGEGAFGTVFQGYRKADKLKVAVKETKREGHNWQDAEEDLKREVKVLQKLQHPNVIKVYDFYIDQEAKRCYVIFELMKGGDLFDTVVDRKKKQGSIPYNELEARGIVYVVMKAVEFMHQYDIVHRDIKPENLLLVSDIDTPTIKIADFGFAEKEAMIKPGICGTAGYMAPEIIEKKPYGKKADVFSLGVVVYILLAGYTPTWKVGHNQAAINEAVKNGDWNFESGKVPTDTDTPSTYQ